MGIRKTIRGLVVAAFGLVILLLGQNYSWTIHEGDNINSKFKNSELLLDSQIENYSIATFAIHPHNYRYEINEPKICESNSPLMLLVVVCTRIMNFNTRQAIRNTWGHC